MAGTRERNFFGAIITIVIKILGVKRNPRDIRAEMSKRAREDDKGGRRREGGRRGGEGVDCRRGCRLVEHSRGMRVEQQLG